MNRFQSFILVSRTISISFFSQPLNARRNVPKFNIWTHNGEMWCVASVVLFLFWYFFSSFFSLCLFFIFGCYGRTLCRFCVMRYTLKVKSDFRVLIRRFILFFSFPSFFLFSALYMYSSGLFYDQKTEFYCGYLASKVDKQNVKNSQFTKNN